MKTVYRIADGNSHGWGSSADIWVDVWSDTWGGGFGTGFGSRDGEAGKGYGYGYRYNEPVFATNEAARRSSRIFRCAGCVGGFECPVHGRRL